MERSETVSGDVTSVPSFNSKIKPILKISLPYEKSFSYVNSPIKSESKKCKVSFRKPLQNVVLVEPFIYETEKKTKSCACQIF